MGKNFRIVARNDKYNTLIVFDDVYKEWFPYARPNILVLRAIQTCLYIQNTEGWNKSQLHDRLRYAFAQRDIPIPSWSEKMCPKLVKSAKFQ